MKLSKEGSRQVARLAEGLYGAVSAISQQYPERVVYSGAFGCLAGLGLQELVGSNFWLGFFVGWIVVNVKIFARLVLSDGVQRDTVIKALDQIERLRLSGASKSEIRGLHRKLAEQLIQQAQLQPIDSRPEVLTGDESEAESSAEQVSQ